MSAIKRATLIKTIRGLFISAPPPLYFMHYHWADSALRANRRCIKRWAHARANLPTPGKVVPERGCGHFGN